MFHRLSTYPASKSVSLEVLYFLVIIYCKTRKIIITPKKKKLRELHRTIQLICNYTNSTRVRTPVWLYRRIKMLYKNDPTWPHLFGYLGTLILSFRAVAAVSFTYLIPLCSQIGFRYLYVCILICIVISLTCLIVYIYIIYMWCVRCVCVVFFLFYPVRFNVSAGPGGARL